MDVLQGIEEELNKYTSEWEKQLDEFDMIRQILCVQKMYQYVVWEHTMKGPQTLNKIKQNAPTPSELHLQFFIPDHGRMLLLVSNQWLFVPQKRSDEEFPLPVVDGDNDNAQDSQCLAFAVMLARFWPKSKNAGEILFNEVRTSNWWNNRLSEWRSRILSAEERLGPLLGITPSVKCGVFLTSTRRCARTWEPCSLHGSILRKGQLSSGIPQNDIWDSLIMKDQTMQNGPMWVHQFMVDIGVYNRLPIDHSRGITLGNETCLGHHDACPNFRMYNTLHRVYKNGSCFDPLELKIPTVDITNNDTVSRLPDRRLLLPTREKLTTNETSSRESKRFFAALSDLASSKNFIDRLNDCLKKCELQNLRLSVVPLVLQWCTEKMCVSHATLLVFDIKKRIQWFYDPSYIEYYDRVYQFSQWMMQFSFVEGYQCDVIKFEDDSLYDHVPSVQHAFETTQARDDKAEHDGQFAASGACTMMCMLFAALIARYGAHGDDLSSLATDLAVWALGMNEREHSPTYDIEGVRWRLYQWQWELMEKDLTLENCQTLLGIRGNCPARPCGAYKKNGTRCGTIAEEGWYMCRKHRTKFLLQAELKRKRDTASDGRKSKQPNKAT